MACDEDDEPEDGPQHYVVISGFYHPHLVTYLTQVGINIDTIIRVQSVDTSDAPETMEKSSSDTQAAAESSSDATLVNNGMFLVFLSCLCSF